MKKDTQEELKNFIRHLDLYFSDSKLKEIAKNLAKKQIPKKPIGVYEETLGKMGRCPDCNHLIHEPYGCNNCIRAIDWEGV